MNYHFEQGIFDGLDSVIIYTERIKMVLVTQIGPRIAFLGRKEDEKNILYWKPGEVVRGDWSLMGGHRVWMTRPLADESEDTYAGDGKPCKVEIGEDFVCATAPVHPFTQLERGIYVRVLGEEQFEVTNFIKNAGSLVYSGGVWSPTCINPEGKTIRIPLGEDDTSWDIVRVMIPRVFAGNNTVLEDPQVTFEGNDMVVRSRGNTTKRCVSAPKGQISMLWPEENLLFIKQVDYVRDGNYPLYGCNIAVFIGQDNWMGELETYGVEQMIRPGETITNKEIWTVCDSEK